MTNFELLMPENDEWTSIGDITIDLNKPLNIQIKRELKKNDVILPKGFKVSEELEIGVIMVYDNNNNTLYQLRD